MITRPFASRTFFLGGEMAHLKGSGQLPARPALGDDSDTAVVGAGGHELARGVRACAPTCCPPHMGARREARPQDAHRGRRLRVSKSRGRLPGPGAGEGVAVGRERHQLRPPQGTVGSLH